MHEDEKNGGEFGENAGLKFDCSKCKSKFKNQKKLQQALILPTLSNINPRSIYNKCEEFHTFVKEESVDLIFLSESWERENLTLKDIIKLDSHEIISNVYQRKGMGGRPAINCGKEQI